MVAKPEPRLDRSALPTGWPEEIVGVDQIAPVLDGTRRRYVNLDNAASTPPLVAARDAVDRFMPWYSSVHRGSGFKSQLSTHCYEAARDAVGRFLGADPRYQSVIFIKNTTEGLNRVAYVMQMSDALVFTSIMEHHANMLTWRFRTRDLRYIGVDNHGRIDLDDLEQQLRMAPTGRPRLVAVSGAYNVTGYTPPIHEIARIAHRYGARILVDGAQLVPHRTVDVRGTGEADRIDLLAFSSHKLYAPYGSGALVAPRDFFEGVPDLVGGGAVELVTLDHVEWAELPDREEAGSPNVVGAVALGAAVERLQALGMANLADHEEVLTTYLLRRLGEVPGLRVLGPQTAEDRVGVVSFVVDRVPHMLIASVLGHEWGIGVRAGCFCAHPGMLHLLDLTCAQLADIQRRVLAHDKTNIPGAARASLGLYNSPDDVDALIDGLTSVVEGRYAGHYEVDRQTGEYLPEGWQPHFEEYFSPSPTLLR